MRRSPRLCGRGGQWGGGSPCLGPSLCLPWAGNKAGVIGVALAMEGVAPIPLRFVLACCPRARSVWCPGVVARVRLSIVVPVGAGGWGVGAGPAPASLPGAAVLPGGGGIIPSASGGGGGRRPHGLRAGGGGGGTGGGVAPWLPTSLSGGGGLRPSAQSPFRCRRIPSRCTRAVGVVGQPRAPRAACHWRGGGGAAREPPPRRGGRGAGGPGGRSASVRPSALPGRATLRASLATLRSWGARPPYCSGSLSRAAPGRGLCVVLAR